MTKLIVDFRNFSNSPKKAWTTLKTEQVSITPVNMYLISLVQFSAEKPAVVTEVFVDFLSYCRQFLNVNISIMLLRLPFQVLFFLFCRLLVIFNIDPVLAEILTTSQNDRQKRKINKRAYRSEVFIK
jgi:hypothetical protein